VPGTSEGKAYKTLAVRLHNAGETGRFIGQRYLSPGDYSTRVILHGPG